MNCSTFKRAAVVVLLFVFVALITYWFKQEIINLTKTYLDWVSEHKIASPFVILIFNIFATLLCFPIPVFNIGTGWALHHLYEDVWIVLILGTCVVSIGLWIGAMLAFILGRTVLRHWVVKFIQDKEIFQAIDKTIKIQGWKFVFLLRICFLIPHNISNYVFGATSIKLRHYAIGCIGIVPLALLEIYTGVVATDI